METINWEIFKYAKNNYQIQNEDIYYVNHMSAYEHSTRKVYGHQHSEQLTKRFSLSALNGECSLSSSNGSIQTKRQRFIVSLIPFYGGRPPNVTQDLKVLSKGQGNSLVSYYDSHRKGREMICKSVVWI